MDTLAFNGRTGSTEINGRTLPAPVARKIQRALVEAYRTYVEEIYPGSRFVGVSHVPQSPVLCAVFERADGSLARCALLLQRPIYDDGADTPRPLAPEDLARAAD